MQKSNIYCAETAKSNKQFVFDFKKIAQKNGFIIHNSETMNMNTSFAGHGINLANDFDLHMIQICKPEKAAKSLSTNPERAVLMPKFVMTFSNNGKTQIRFLRYSKEEISEVVDDDTFPGSLTETYDHIVAIINQAM